MITLTLRGDVWMARWHGPEAALVRDAFGTDEIPTPYTAASDPALVLRAIATRNPRHEVLMAHADGCVCDVCGDCPDCDNGSSGPIGTYCKRCHRTQR